jgi:hypothetical protein
MATPSLGSQMLQKFIDAGSRQTDVASRVSHRLGRDVHQTTISGWATGRHAPQGPAMVALLEIAGIPIEAWLSPPLVSEQPEAT